MHLISTRVHGILDYAVGLILIASPFVMGFDDNSAAQWIPIVVGSAVIVFSLITDYEYSLARIIPMPLHLALDVVGGIFLVMSPWLFGFDNRLSLPHVAFGLLAIVVATLTASHATRTLRDGFRRAV